MLDVRLTRLLVVIFQVGSGWSGGGKDSLFILYSLFSFVACLPEFSRYRPCIPFETDHLSFTRGGEGGGEMIMTFLPVGACFQVEKYLSFV